MKKMKLSTPKKEYIEKVMGESSPQSDTERTASPRLNVKTKQKGSPKDFDTTVKGIDLPLVIRKDDGSGISIDIYCDDEGTQHLQCHFFKPDNMKMVKWEKILVRVTKAMSELGISITRVDR